MIILLNLVFDFLPQRDIFAALLIDLAMFFAVWSFIDLANTNEKNAEHIIKRYMRLYFN